MENKADYAELRRLYFGHRENDRTPSHSKVSNYEKNKKRLDNLVFFYF